MKISRAATHLSHSIRPLLSLLLAALVAQTILTPAPARQADAALAHHTQAHGARPGAEIPITPTT
ncbi:MAG TPA: hypothetical protein EYH30_05240, partial [Anaerolineales bacterium]|nr:hypothetical protein [Anaerolineales bacterium]